MGGGCLREVVTQGSLIALALRKPRSLVGTCTLPSISINSSVLEVTDNFTLLGSTITSKYPLP